jgi:hypothetical protein
MSEIVQHLSPRMHDGTEKTRIPKQSRQTTNTSMDNQTIISSLTGYENDLGDKLERLERDAEIQVQQNELSECLMFVAQLVDLFKHSVITFELQNQSDWHDDTQHNLKQHNGVTGNRLFDDKIEKIIINKGLTKEQWNCLLYMSLNTGDTVEITKVSQKHLKNVHEKALRLLEDNEQNAVFALINAIGKHMLKDHFIDK